MIAKLDGRTVNRREREEGVYYINIGKNYKTSVNSYST